MTDLGALGGSQSAAYGINDRGQVVGEAETGGGGYVAFLYSNGAMTNLGTLGGAYADGINDSGQAVGENGAGHAFLYSNGTMTDLGTFGGQSSSAQGINASGQVVGEARISSGSYHAFLYSNGTKADLGTLPGYSYSNATGINVTGQVAGWSWAGGTGPTHAFLESNGTMADLGTLPGGENSLANGINDSGQVVGYADISGGTFHAFLYSNGTMTDLNSLIDPTSGWTLVEALAVNDNGWIVGVGSDPAGGTRAFLLTPVPEPSTLILLGAIGLIGFAWRRRRGRARCLAGAAVVAAMLIAGSAQAQTSVFNMGGTRDPVTGTWTGAASLEFVTVGNPGNYPAAYGPVGPGFAGHGSVDYVYQMGKYDVTVGQYCQFLNAVATTSDPYGLYNTGMAADIPTVAITQSGSSGNYTYSVTGSYSQAANCPIFDVSWGDAARFCNWLQNGQPVGSEGAGTTETGAYTLNGDTTNLLTETRNAGAAYFIPSLDEWTKAAYYNGGTSSYWYYPTQSRAKPSNILSAAGTNNANFYDSSQGGTNVYTDPVNYLTPVGAFAGSPGPYGTYDMGGDAWQWSETVFYGNLGQGAIVLAAVATTANRLWQRTCLMPATRRSSTPTWGSAWQVSLFLSPVASRWSLREGYALRPSHGDGGEFSPPGSGLRYQSTWARCRPSRLA